MSANAHLISELLDALRRRRKLFFTVVVLVTSLVTLIGVQKPRVYTASAIVVIEPQKSLVDQGSAQSDLSDEGVDESIIQTQIRLAKSEENIRRAITRLTSLEASRISLLKEIEPTVSPLGRVFRSIGEWLQQTELIPSSFSKELVRQDEPETEGTDTEELVSKLHESLHVEQSGESHVLSIDFSSVDPVRAAEIANMIAESFTESQAERKIEIADQANRWLRDRVDELRDKVQQSDNTIREYRVESGIQASENDGADVQLLRVQRIEAHAEITAKQSRLQLITDLKDSGKKKQVREALSSPVMATLRQREIDLLRDEAQLSREYGDQHPLMIQLESEIQKLDERMDQELQNYINEQEDELSIASNKLKQIDSLLREFENRTIKNSSAEVRLNELERDAEAQRQTYTYYLSRLNQLENQKKIIRPDARIVSEARVPEDPSSASPVRYAALGFTASLVLALVLAVSFEQGDRTVRSPSQIEKALDTETLAMIPVIAAGKNISQLHQYLTDNPRSAYSEGISRLYMSAIKSENHEHTPVILLTSALPNEGKTSLSSSLAVYSNRIPDRGRSLLLDLDMRNPSVFKSFDIKPGDNRIKDFTSKAGVLSGKMVADIVHGLDILAIQAGSESPVILLDPTKLSPFLQELRDEYDLIVIDAPPILGTSDAVLISNLVDVVTLVVRWKTTKMDAVKAALERMKKGDGNVHGVILNQVNLDEYAYHNYGDEGQYYNEYKKYYDSAVTHS